MPGQITLQADRIYVATDENDSGGLIFESMTVNGSAGLGLRELRIGDLQVSTLKMVDAAATVPGYEVLASDMSTTSFTVWSTFITDTFNIQGISGTEVAVKILLGGTFRGQETDPPVAIDLRLLRNVDGGGDVVVYNFGIPGVGQNYTQMRIVLDEFVANGALQTVTYRWQFKTNAGTNTTTVDAGASHTRVAYKR
jgi:hypothetical protein